MALIDHESISDSTQAEQFIDLLNKTQSTLNVFALTINTKTLSFSLSFAAPAGAQNHDLLEFSGMDEFLDYWDSMGYDYTGSWNTISGVSANLYNSSTNPLLPRRIPTQQLLTIF
jgi:chitinase